MHKEYILQKIEEVFAGIALGNGIGLNEAQAIDDYQSSEGQAKARQKDEKVNWKLLNYNELQRCYSSLSFFDADGMRFHLPAYIIAELKEQIDDLVIFHLTHLNEYGQSQFTSLNDAQCKAIIMFLEWCLQQENYEFDHLVIKQALNEYWKKGLSTSNG